MVGCDKKNPSSSENSGKKERLEAKLLTTLKGHTHSVYSVTFSPDGITLVSGSGDDTIKLWSLPDGELLKTLTGHSDIVKSVTFSPDGMMLASGSDDETIKLWSFPDGNPHWCLYDPALVNKTEYRTVSQKDKITSNSICTCDLVCICDTITVSPGTPLAGQIVCTCDTVTVGNICTCDSVSTSCSSCSSCGYWYPN